MWSVKGFFGFYEFVDEGLIGPPVREEKSCGGDEKGFGGIISSPNYPNSFPKSIDCMWLIRVQQNQHIYLRIMQLQLFGSIANCKEAHLAIYDGYENYDYEHHEPKKYCGDLKYYKSLDDKVQLSANNRLLIRFKSEITAPQWEEQVATQEITGFKLIWTAVTFKPKADCQHFLCSKSEFCLTPQSGSTCKRKEYFCIDKSLKCDGIPNCSEQDSSDEDQCNVSNRLYTIVTILGLISVSCGLICFLCHCRRRRRRRSNLDDHRSSVSQSGLHGSGSSAFTVKTTSDGSISVKHLNHSPQSSSYVLVANGSGGGENHDTPSSPPSELLLPLDTFYRRSQNQNQYQQAINQLKKHHHHHHHHRSTTMLTPEDEATLPLLLASSSVPSVNHHTGSLRTPRHHSNKHHNQQQQLTKPLSASSLGNIIVSTSTPPVGKCSIHGQRSNLFQVPPPPPLTLHDNNFYTLGSSQVS
ncbi:uncharacterized protein LOC128387382 [Panonychus citri]|uniref:uncharacterized protein LOC128387382 n=1 Tax=Panonychus citri TaxID=50023 RepID=UPI002307999F|nr:uncharacterized protein LOC128387382 [Panonychus citri]